MTAQELTAWIVNGQEPEWAEEQLGESHEPAAERSSSKVSQDLEEVVDALVVPALRQMMDRSWEYDIAPGTAIDKAARHFNEFREDINLWLDAAGFGYWIGVAEAEVSSDPNVFDPDFTQSLREWLEDDPGGAVTAGMSKVAEALPGPFSLGADVWRAVLDDVIPILEERAELLLAQEEDWVDELSVPREEREFAIKLGYGMSLTVRSLGIEGTRPRQ